MLVGRLVDIHVTNTIEVLDHRNRRLTADALDESLTTPRHDDVDVFIELQQCSPRGSVGHLNQLHCLWRQVHTPECAGNARGDGFVGMKRLGSTAQDARVARLQAETRGIRRHIGARFIDDADHPEWHPHLSHLNPTRSVRQVRDGTHRIRQRADCTNAIGHSMDGFRVDRQTIEQRRCNVLAARLTHVELVGADDLLGVCHEGISNGGERSILRARRRARHDARCAASRLTHIEHVVGDVHHQS